MKSVFGDFAPKYRELGLEPRPISPGQKGCKIRGWQNRDAEIPNTVLESWLSSNRSDGIGLLMGTPLPDGTRLGAFDVDKNEYVEIMRTLLKHPVCARFGSKGIAYFVRYRGNLKNYRIKTEKTKTKPIVECLFDRSLCIIPPTIHPSTSAPYEWVGKSLLDVELNDLPIIEG